MKKKIVLMLLLVLVFAVADEYLVRVDLTEDRLTPLAAHGLKILAELESTAIILLSETQFDEITAFDHEILDHQPEQGYYYLVRPFDPAVDISPFGDVLMKDGEDYLIKLNETMLEALMKKKVMLKRLSFTPMVIKSEVLLPPVFFNYTVQEIVDSVNADTLLSMVQRLQDLVTRHSMHDSCMAAALWISDKFTAYGLDSVFLQYHETGHAPNVIGIKHGTTYPDSIYPILCGHFDSYTFYSPDLAPGADDNASGTAAVIEAARVMRDYEFEYSVRYIAFSGEEFGMYGSQHYAQLARAAGDSILGVINGDMLSYVDIQPESLDVFAKPYNPNCDPFADFFIAAADTYTTLRTKKHLSTMMIYSDHSPFWDQGYLALCNIDDFPVTNLYIHTPEDTIGAGYNNNALHTEATKAEIAALALMAVPDETGITEFDDPSAENTQFSVSPTIGKNLFTISLYVESTRPMNLRIYDVTGQTVRNISIQSSSIGHPLSIKWNGTDKNDNELPGGVYFVHYEGDRRSHTAKLILLR